MTTWGYEFASDTAAEAALKRGCSVFSVFLLFSIRTFRPSNPPSPSFILSFIFVRWEVIYSGMVLSSQEPLVG